RLTHTRVRHNYRYLKREPRVAFSIVDPDDGYRYLQLRGVIEQVENDPTGAFYQRLQQRYRGTTSEVADRDVRVVLTIRPTGFKARSGRGARPPRPRPASNRHASTMPLAVSCATSSSAVRTAWSMCSASSSARPRPAPSPEFSSRPRSRRPSPRPSRWARW